MNEEITATDYRNVLERVLIELDSVGFNQWCSQIGEATRMIKQALKDGENP